MIMYCSAVTFKCMEVDDEVTAAWHSISNQHQRYDCPVLQWRLNAINTKAMIMYCSAVTFWCMEEEGEVTAAWFSTLLFLRGLFSCLSVLQTASLP
jgi:hypothetical protein